MADVLADFEAQSGSLVDQALAELAPGTRAPPLEVPAAGQADLALACFALAKDLKRAPAQIAAELAARVEPHLAGRDLVERVEATGGYVNFFVDRAEVARRVVPAVLAAGPEWGRLPPKKAKVVLEHTSANPNGPLHVGRARNPILGDTLARILRKAGWDVETQYYLDDLGKQVAILAWGRTHLAESDLPKAAREKIDHAYVRYYQVANERMEKDPAVAAAIQDLVRRSEHADAATLALFEEAYGPVLEGMKASLGAIGVAFDSFVKESRFVQNGATEEVIRRLEASPLSRREEDGALWLDLATHGVAGRSQRFVYRRSDGTSLYPTRDVAYHLWKAEQAGRLVNVLGEDHKLEAKQVRVALEILGCPTLPEVVFYAFVSLPEGKMSTRRGRVVYLDDLIDEAVERAYEEVKQRRGDELDEAALGRIARAVGVGALRFNIVRVQPEKGITFAWEEALNFEGASAPFLQYAYARCASILRKAAAEGDASASQGDDPAHPSELELARQLARLPRVVDEAARRDAPHAVATYGLELATALNAFYRDCPVLSAESPQQRTARLRLVEAAKHTLHATLDLLGVPVLEEM